MKCKVCGQESDDLYEGVCKVCQDNLYIDEICPECGSESVVCVGDSAGFGCKCKDCGFSIWH